MLFFCVLVQIPDCNAHTSEPEGINRSSLYIRKATSFIIVHLLHSFFTDCIGPDNLERPHCLKLMSGIRDEQGSSNQGTYTMACPVRHFLILAFSCLYATVLGNEVVKSFGVLQNLNCTHFSWFYRRKCVAVTQAA
jgi:hypothetical protein